MPKILNQSSVVVIANDVNISIFRESWLLRNQVLREDELGGQTLFSPAVVQVGTDLWNFLVVPNRIQLTFKQDYEGRQNDMLRIVGRIADLLPHTPFTGVGLNLHYRLRPDGGDGFLEWNHREFRSTFVDRLDGFGAGDNLYGTNFQMDFEGITLKGELRPATALQTIGIPPYHIEQGQSLMAASYNFHADLSDPPDPQEIRRTLERFNEVSQIADEFSDLLLGQGGG